MIALRGTEAAPFPVFFCRSFLLAGEDICNFANVFSDRKTVSEVYMLITPKPIGKMELSPEELSKDKKACTKYGPCGVGEKAIYLGSFYISRRFYAPYPEIRRVFKRVAMSAGGFTGKGAFGTMPYLVVVLKDGTEKQSNFKREEDVDKILA